jgi:hypothetical protein
VIDDGFQTSKYTLKLIFKNSRDGFKINEINWMCKGKQNILVVVQSEHGSIFGWFTSHV